MKQRIARPIATPPGRPIRALPAVSGGAPTTIVSQTVLSDGVTLRLVGSVALTAGSLTGLTAANVTMASASIVGGNLDIVITKVYDDQPVGNITYDGTGTLAGADGAVAAFGPVAITNDSAQPITGISGTIDLWKWNDLTRLWTTSALSTNVASVADPVGGWRGQLDAYTLTQATAPTRFEYQSAGILANSTSVFKEMSANFAQASADPFSVLMRYVGTSGNNPRVGGYVGSTLSTGTGPGATIFGRARTGTPANSTVSSTGDKCVVVSFDGTNAFVKVQGSSAVTITPGSEAGAIATIRATALTAGAVVANIKYLQFIAGAVSEETADAWFNWAMGQP